MPYMISYKHFGGPSFDFIPWPDQALTDLPNSPLGFFWGTSGKWENEVLLPKRLVNREDNRTREDQLPHLFLAAGRWCVDDLFKATIEGLEPGQHQFVPLTLEDRDGGLIRRQYYLFNAIGWFDCVRDVAAKVPVPPFGGTVAAIPKQSIPQRHCWHDHYSMSPLFISDELAEELKTIVGDRLRCTKLEEI